MRKWKCQEEKCAAAGLDLSRAEAVGSGRACQRPRTSSVAKCFSCEGALAKDPQIFKFFQGFEIIVALGGAGLSDEQREEMTNREGVAAGGATQICGVFEQSVFFLLKQIFCNKIILLIVMNQSDKTYPDVALIALCDEKTEEVDMNNEEDLNNEEVDVSCNYKDSYKNRYAISHVIIGKENENIEKNLEFFKELNKKANDLKVIKLHLSCHGSYDTVPNSKND